MKNSEAVKHLKRVLLILQAEEAVKQERDGPVKRSTVRAFDVKTIKALETILVETKK